MHKNEKILEKRGLIIKLFIRSMAKIHMFATNKFKIQ